MIHCGYVTAQRAAYLGVPQSTEKTAVLHSSKVVFRTARAFYADMLCLKLDYYLLF